MKNIIQQLLHTITDSPVVLFRAGNVIFVKFGIICALASLLGISAFIYSLHRFGISLPAMDTLLSILPFMMVGWSILFNYALSIRDIIAEPHRLKNVSFSCFGALTGIVLSFIITARMHQLDILLLCDSLFLILGFAHGLPRIACINYGCCHGREMDPKHYHNGRIFIRYRNDESKAVRVSGLKDKALYPTQIYEMLGCFGLQLVMIALYAADTRPGIITGSYCMLYGALRFLCERYRGEGDTRYHYGLSDYQWVSMGIGLVGSGILLHAVGFSTAITSRLLHATPFSLFPYSAYMLLLSLFIFIGYGFHYKEIGKWF